MQSLVQYYLEAVRNKNYQSVATFLEVYPHLKELTIEGLHPGAYALKHNDAALFNIFWGLLDHRKTPFSDSLESQKSSEIDSDILQATTLSAHQVKDSVYESYGLSKGVHLLKDNIFKLHAEQFYIMTGHRPVLTTSDHNPSKKPLRVLQFRLPLDEALISKVKCALHALGVSYKDDIMSRDAYVIEVNAAQMLNIATLFETGHAQDVHLKVSQNDKFTPHEKVALFDMCFDNKSHDAVILGRFHESPLYYLYETDDFCKHLRSITGAWVTQFAKSYLADLMVPMEQLDADVSEGFEREGSKEILASMLGLPSPQALSKDLSDLSKAHREALYEICFTPRDFIDHFKQRIRTEHKMDIDSLLLSEMKRYQFALKQHLPASLDEFNTNLSAWQFWRRNKGHFVLYGHDSADASSSHAEPLNQSEIKKKTERLNH